MRKEVKHIDNVPFNWIGVDAYSSHRQMLWLALNNTDGAVIEFGSGEGSTMLLYHECKKQKRYFISYENNEGYANKYPKIVTKICNYAAVFLAPDKSVLFIDSAPGEQREELIDRHKNNAGVIIVHDTEIGAQSIYGIADVLNSFKYRLDYYPDGLPGTTALSNKIDVTQWD